MSQDVNQDWVNREFIEQVEVGIRKCVDFLNNFHESARYRISEIDQRLNSLERKLDFTQAQLANCDPSKRGAQPKPFKNSVFDPEIRRQLITKQNERREKSVNVFTDQVIAPKKSDFSKMIVGNARKQPNASPIVPSKPNGNPDGNVPKDKDKDDKGDNVVNVVNNNPRPPPSSAQAQADLIRSQPPPPKQEPPPPRQEPPPPKQEPPPPRQEPPPPRQEPPPPKSDIQQIQQVQPPPPKPQLNDKKEEEDDVDTPNPDNDQEGGKPKFPHGKSDEIDILVIEASNGPKPQTTSKVEIEYKGFLPNGDEFISHREEILLGKRQNIKGLELGVCSMNVGSKAKLWIPSKLGYGAKGAPGLIPPDTNLTFEITLHQILPE